MNLRRNYSPLILMILATLMLPTAWAHYDTEAWSDDYADQQFIPWDYSHQGPGRHQQGWHYWPSGYPFAGPQHRYGPFQGLDLTRDQRKHIDKIFRDARSAMHRIRDQISDKRQELYDLLDESSDKKAVQQLADQIGKLTAERIVLRSDTHSRIKALLTPEQQEKFDQRMFDRF